MATRPKDLFTPRAAGSNVFLSCHGHTCRVFGASIPVSALPGEEARSFTAHLPEGQDRGLIAVAVNYQLNGKGVWSNFIIEFTRGEDGCAYATLDHPWVPEGERIAQIDYLGLTLVDVTSGDRFTTCERAAKEHGLSYVPDGNLLMRCLAGLATLDDVRAAAQAQAEEMSVRERLAEIEPRIARIDALAAEAGVAVADLDVEYRRLKEIARCADELLLSIKNSDQRAPFSAIWDFTPYQQLLALFAVDPKKA